MSWFVSGEILKIVSHVFRAMLSANYRITWEKSLGRQHKVSIVSSNEGNTFTGMFIKKVIGSS